MKRLSAEILVLSLFLLVPVVTAQALPVWLPGTTVVATAGTQNPGTMDITAMMLEANSASVLSNANSVTFMNGSMTDTMNTWELSWTTITLDRDPHVNFVGGFLNISGADQDFVFSTSTPISPSLPSPTLYGGSTTVTYGDANFDGSGGLFNDSSNSPAYAGTIDGSAQLNMLTSLSLTPDLAGQTKAAPPESQGLPGPTILGPAANSTIGILHRFELSDGDQATFNSSFIVVIPEPGTIGLLATGLGGLAFLGRRRQS